MTDLNPHLFHILDGATAITRHKGLFRQTTLYTRDGYIYAKHGSGFARIIRLSSSRMGTSVPDLDIDGLDIPNGYGFDTLGRMCTTDAKHLVFNEQYQKRKAK